MQRDVLQLFKEHPTDNLFFELQKEYGGLIVYYASKIHRSTKYDGEELEDCIQQCWICFLKAVKNFDISSGYNFTAFLVSCLTNYTFNYLRDFYRRKEKLKTVSYNNYLMDDESLSYLELFESEDKSPAEEYEIKEALEKFNELNKLTRLEKDVFLSYLRGYTYDEMAKIFDVPKKKIDNIIRKVKVSIVSKNR